MPSNIFTLKRKLSNYKTPLLKQEFLEYQLYIGNISIAQYNILYDAIEARRA